MEIETNFRMIYEIIIRDLISSDKERLRMDWTSSIFNFF